MLAAAEVQAVLAAQVAQADFVVFLPSVTAVQAVLAQLLEATSVCLALQPVVLVQLAEITLAYLAVPLVELATV